MILSRKINGMLALFMMSSIFLFSSCFGETDEDEGDGNLEEEGPKVDCSLSGNVKATLDEALGDNPKSSFNLQLYGGGALKTMDGNECITGEFEKLSWACCDAYHCGDCRYYLGYKEIDSVKYWYFVIHDDDRDKCPTYAGFYAIEEFDDDNDDDGDDCLSGTHPESSCSDCEASEHCEQGSSSSGVYCLQPCGNDSECCSPLTCRQNEWVYSYQGTICSDDGF